MSRRALRFAAVSLPRPLASMGATVTLFAASILTFAAPAQAADVTPPSAVVSLAVGQASPTTTSPIVFTVSFSEPVAGFSDGDVDFTGTTAGGTLTGVVTGGPTNYTVSVTGMTTSGNVKVTVPAGAAQDASNNPSTVSNTITVAWQSNADVTPPSVTPTKQCNGVDATIVGTSGDDVLVGTSGPDVIVGLGGHDQIRGQKGNDILCGADGNDLIKGGKGNDLLFGGSGDDRLKGNRGNDKLYGQSGTDACRGGPGSDTGSTCE